VSKLWGWDVAKKQFPDLKAIFHIKPGSLRRPSLEIALFTAYGIDEADIVWVNEPVWLESVVSASPMWHNENPHYVHPSIRDTWRRLSNGLVIEPAKTTDGPADRIFVSRSGSFKHRFCRNAAEVEAFFEARGFHVLYPEHLSMAEQVRAFASAKTIAGFGGSAMFNLMHAEQVETVILLAHEAYTARNEHLFASVLGCDTHYFWSSPDVAHPPDGWTHAAFYSPWDFDFERNGRTLDELIGSL
jgi:capsular polysaccharide biosynthesis protein